MEERNDLIAHVMERLGTVTPEEAALVVAFLRATGDITLDEECGFQLADNADLGAAYERVMAATRGG